MAVEVFPDNPSAAMSPRISFSQDLRSDAVAIEHYNQSSSSSTIDFDFCVFDHDSSSADELFSDGKILPIEIRKRLAPLPPPLRSSPPPPPPPPPHPPIPKSAAEEKQQGQKTASFWGFKRSASLNCGSGYARTLCPLPIMSRSNSTGSTAAAAASVKRSSSSGQKQSPLKYPSPNSALKLTPSTNYQKPPLKKNGYAYNGGAKITPVLNVPSANLLKLGSIFSGGKDKAKKKGLF